MRFAVFGVVAPGHGARGARLLEGTAVALLALGSAVMLVLVLAVVAGLSACCWWAPTVLPSTSFCRG
ncbi:MAG TPA: hypothetical protein VLE45_07570 [Burkholderiaceae bacterium]|nr:hypothetical protein [Burkholderiaceae bacterium]